MGALEKIIKIQNVEEAYKVLNQFTALPDFSKWKQIALTSKRGKDLFDGVGSLYDHQKNEFVAQTEEFSVLNNVFAGTAVQNIIEVVKSIASENFGVKIGRIRMMRLEPKTCLSYHIDPDEFRFHIPLATNKKCFFVVDDLVFRMDEVASLYKFQTNLPHTAVNASLEVRDHLVFDTYGSAK